MEVILSNQMVETKDPKDKTDKVLAEIDRWKKLKLKGSMTLHFDGGGNIARFQLTFEGT
jgi:hypothetical protein